jgi:hypothetical protein
MTEVITKVRKFLVAQTEEELAALVATYRVFSWHTVGDPICASSGLVGFGSYRQVIEKEMPDRISALFQDRDAEHSIALPGVVFPSE